VSGETAGHREVGHSGLNRAQALDIIKR
jgi:hypothetical protein